MEAPPRPAVRFLPPVLIGLATVLAFLPSLRGEFLLWDDDANFLHNPYFRGFTAENLRWMFTNAFGHYMPLTWLTLALDYEIGGMNPVGYHVTNLFLHAVNAALFYQVLGLLLRRAAPDLDETRTRTAAAVGALFFSLHPLRVESVAWITERRDLLSGVFFLLTVLAYLRMAGEPAGSSARIRALVLATLAFAGMLLSKTMGLTLPLVFLVLDVYPLRRWSRAALPGLLKEKIPLFLLMGVALVMLSISAGRAGGMSDRQNYPLIQSLARPGYALTFYLAKTLLPVGLSPLYWFRPEIGLPQLAGWVVVLALTAGLLVQRRRFPGLLAAWMAYGLLIAPGSGLVSLGSFIAADHYSYVACLPFAAAAAGLPLLVGRNRSMGVAVGLCAALLLALGVQSWRYCAVWIDSVALWTRAIEIDPDVYFSHGNLGRALAARGQWDAAIAEYTVALDREPRWHEPWGHRARARLVRGDAAGAVEDATRALALDPAWSEAYVTRGLAFSKLGRPREAIADYTKALEKRPQFMDALVNRAFERGRIGDAAGAVADLDRAVAFDPQPGLLARRGMFRAMQGNLQGAAADFETALRVAPPDWSQRVQVEEHLRRVRAEQPR